MIDQSKTYRTRNGLPVRVYATDGAETQPVHGAMFDDGQWYTATWDAKGSVGLGEHLCDLVESDPHGILPRHRELLASVYEEMDYKNAAFGLRDAALPVTEMRYDLQAALIALARLESPLRSEVGK